MTSNPALNRRSFLARGAAIAGLPAVASLAGGAVAEPASADALPDFAPIPPSALGVLSGEVVNAGDGWPVAEAAVGPPAVVVADE